MTRWIYKLPLRLRSLLSKGRVQEELSDELRFHLEKLTEQNVSKGMAPEESRYAALRELGGVEQIKEECRDMRRINLIEDLVRDFAFGLRQLRCNPGFTIVAVLTLALGIGANTAIFSILETELWRPLPFPHSERLMDCHLVLRKNPRQWDVLYGRVFQAWEAKSRSFTSLSGYGYPAARNFSARGTSERVVVMPITSNFFGALQLPVARGRAFLSNEATLGHDHVAILSFKFWQGHFGSDPGVLGKAIVLDDELYTIVGIASPRLRLEYMDEPAIFTPLVLNSSQVMRALYAVGRLVPGVLPSRAQEELTLIAQRELTSEGIKADDVAAVGDLRETWTGFAARPLYFFAGAVALVLLIACLNTAGLLLARGLARQREFAVRAALGAGRGRLLRQLLAESMTLALAGGAAGAVAGLWLARWMAAFLPEDALPRHAPATLDLRVFSFILAVSLFSALLVGVAPALFASRADLNDVLRQSAPGRSGSRSQQRVRNSLVAVEVAVGLVLLFGAGLFLVSFRRLQEAPRGFDAPGALTFRVSLRGERYAVPDQVKRYFDLLSERLRSLAGVSGVTFGSRLPLTGASLFACVNVAGRPPLARWGLCLDSHSVAPNYFQLLHMRLLAGRTFTSEDRDGSPRVAIINRNAARRMFGREDPLGKVLDYVPDEQRGVPGKPPVQIVGVVENAQEYNANEVPFDVMYVPFSQQPVSSAYLLLSSKVSRGALAAAIRAAAYDVDKDQPIFDMQAMDTRIADSLRGARFDLFLVGALAAVGLLLVSVGTFGTVAYFVEQRTQEFGIRLALGATPGGILCHALAQSMRIGTLGITAGVTASIILGRLLAHELYLVPHVHSGMLYGVKIYDPFIMSFACVLLLLVLMLASYIPARRAARVDPMIALRYE